MAVSIEDILMARAQQEEEQRMDPATSMVLGAGLGGTAGVTVGGMGRRLNPDGSIQGKAGRRMARWFSWIDSWWWTRSCCKRINGL